MATVIDCLVYAMVCCMCYSQRPRSLPINRNISA